MLARFTLSALLPALLLAPAGAQNTVRAEERMRYQACIAQSGEEPAAALEEAQTWRIEGGGWPAEICEAHAFIGLGDFQMAAAILEELAGEPRAGMVNAERVDFLTLAGETRARAGDTETALEDYAAALEIDPYSVLTLTMRGRLHRDEESWGALERDAQRLVDLVPENAEGWYLRSLYHLNTGDLDAAEADMEAARERAPERIEILVLRGDINEARRQAAAD